MRTLAFDTSLVYVDKRGNHPKYLMPFINEPIDRFLDRTVKVGRIYTLEFGFVGKNFGHIIIVERLKSGIRFYDPQ